MAFSIRQATTGDIATIRSVALSTWPAAYGGILSAAQLTYMLDRMYSVEALAEQFNEGHSFLVAEVDVTAVGFVSFAPHHLGEPVTRIHKLYVLPAHQRMGIGAAFVKEVQSAAAQAGDGVLGLNVNRQNRALDFYIKHGFRVVRDEVIDIGNGFVMDDHVMERRHRWTAPHRP